MSDEATVEATPAEVTAAEAAATEEPVEIHLPGPSPAPIIVAAGMTLVVTGLLSPILLFIGIGLLVLGIGIWAFGK